MLQDLCSYSVLLYGGLMIPPCDMSGSWLWFIFVFTWAHKVWCLFVDFVSQWRYMWFSTLFSTGSTCTTGGMRMVAWW